MLQRAAVVFIAVLVLLLSAGCGGGRSGSGPDASRKLLILHTNDLHSHLNGHDAEADYSPLTTGNDATIGGIARLAAQVGRERAGAGSASVLLLDAGEFMMGTPFEALALSASAELAEMSRMGYDAITLGNHEFDWTPRALAGIIGAAVGAGAQTPIVATNLQFDPVSPADDDLQRLETLGYIQRKLVKTLPNGLKVGIFGLMGKDAINAAAAAAPLTFADPILTAQAMADQLRNIDKVDVVIALSHGGIDAAGKGEDADLAKAVGGPGKANIDVIISGHTHVALDQPVRVNSTLIVQAGSHGENLGRLEIDVPTAGGSVSALSYRLVKIDDTIAADPVTQARVDGYINMIDALINPFKYRQPITRTNFDLKRASFVETTIGDLVTDAFRTAASALDGPVDVAIVSNGEIRTNIAKGATGVVWFADAFRVVPLGIGPDARPGYPLVTLYLNGRDMKAAMEVGAAAVDVFGAETFLQVSGMSFAYDPAAPPFNRVKTVSVGGAAVNLNDTTRCYKVAASLFVASAMAQIRLFTAGALSITPKLADCATAVTDVSTRILRVPSAAGPQEMKGWLALVQYLAQLKGASGASEIPDVYANTQGRITR